MAREYMISDREKAELDSKLSEPEATFQRRVRPWMMVCFGEEISADRVERGDRLLEEVFELLQSGGYNPARVLSLRDYVWSRDKGEPSQEVGGVMVTLAAYCLAHELDMHDAGETELARIWTKVEKIRAKQAAKPTGSALPVAIAHIDHGKTSFTAALARGAVPVAPPDSGAVEALLLQLRGCLSRAENGTVEVPVEYIEGSIAALSVAQAPAQPEKQQGVTAEALKRAWSDFCDANPDGLTSPEDLPDHALMTCAQFVEYATAALQVGEADGTGRVEVSIAHDGFAGTIQGRYVTREGKRGVVVQQHDTRVVHVYGEKWLTAPASKPEACHG